MDDVTFRLKPVDRSADDDDEQTARAWSNEGELSALAESQILVLLGKLGAIRSVLLQALADPNRRSATPESRAIRQALSLASEGVTIVQAITYSTTRRERL